MNVEGASGEAKQGRTTFEKKRIIPPKAATQKADEPTTRDFRPTLKKNSRLCPHNPQFLWLHTREPNSICGAVPMLDKNDCFRGFHGRVFVVNFRAETHGLAIALSSHQAEAAFKNSARFLERSDITL